MNARVVRFTDVSPEQIDAVVTRVEESDGPPPGVESSAMKLLYDSDQGTATSSPFSSPSSRCGTRTRSSSRWTPPTRQAPARRSTGARSRSSGAQGSPRLSPTYAAVRSGSRLEWDGSSTASSARSLALRRGTKSANPSAATSAIRHIRNDSVKAVDVAAGIESQRGPARGREVARGRRPRVPSLAASVQEDRKPAIVFCPEKVADETYVVVFECDLHRGAI